MKRTNHPRWQAILRGEEIDGFEPREVFHERVVATLEQLVEAHAGERIVVVCHGGVINAYLSHVLGLPASRGFFYPNYTSIHRVVASRSGHRSISTVNETAHLRGTGLPVGLNP
jgi:probable phosphoglycerate mutase